MRKSPFSSSVGRKLLIAITGLALFAFLVLHLANNLIVFAGPGTFNKFAETLGGNPLVLAFEVGLAALFLAHIIKAVSNFAANRKARPVQYHTKKWAGDPSRKSLASATMIGTGSLVLFFLILHLKHFRFGDRHGDGGLYGLEMRVFSDPFTVLFYTVSMVAIGFHIWHGFWSAFQSLGLGNKRYTPALNTLAKALAILIAGGFIVIPIWAFLTGGTR